MNVLHQSVESPARPDPEEQDDPAVLTGLMFNLVKAQRTNSSRESAIDIELISYDKINTLIFLFSLSFGKCIVNDVMKSSFSSLAVCLIKVSEIYATEPESEGASSSPFV